MASHTAAVFEELSGLECIKDYCLIGGTALALQLGHRLSEDLDFCRWKTQENERISVDWPGIETELSRLGRVSRNLLDHNQCDFNLNGVKLTFYDNNISMAPTGLVKQDFLNNIRIADKTSIGIMKIEVMLRRYNFRDYYDIYAILKDGASLKDLVEGAGKYSRHRLKTRDMFTMLVKGENFAADNHIPVLQPKYRVNANDIERFLTDEIKKMNEKKLRAAQAIEKKDHKKSRGMSF
ncbi:MAG: nucleotidyl transferase AbiEii/AbiGii toxin family protein [Bacteroidales bacterium]|nr:nucleotidyl transferase AbiEii/AbiGii toxin family protein [Bacteroidales bacterium]